MRFNKCIDLDEFLSSYEEPAKNRNSDVAVSPETSLTDLIQNRFRNLNTRIK